MEYQEGHLKIKTERLTENLKDLQRLQAGGIRKKGGSVPWQTLKIPFITGGPGPADAKEPHQKPQVITCKRNFSRWFGSQQNVLAVPGARQNRPLALNID